MVFHGEKKKRLQIYAEYIQKLFFSKCGESVIQENTPIGWQGGRSCKGQCPALLKAGVGELDGFCLPVHLQRPQHTPAHARKSEQRRPAAQSSRASKAPPPPSRLKTAVHPVRRRTGRERAAPQPCQDPGEPVRGPAEQEAPSAETEVDAVTKRGGIPASRVTVQDSGLREGRSRRRGGAGEARGRRG